MPKMLRPQDVAIIREALEYRAEPLDAEDLALMLSDNINDPLSEEQKQAETLLQKICALQSEPETGLVLSDEDKAFIVVSLKRLISFYDDMIKTEKRSKVIRDHEKEIRAARVCISQLAKPCKPASGSIPV